MTVGNLVILLLIILYGIWGFYSIKDLIKNKKSNNINLSTLVWFSLLFSFIITSSVVFLIFYWNYKLF